jgi:hypothetical protein
MQQRIYVQTVHGIWAADVVTTSDYADLVTAVPKGDPAQPTAGRSSHFSAPAMLSLAQRSDEIAASARWLDP